LSTGIQEQLPQGWSWAKLGEIAEINPSTRVGIEDEAAPVNFVPMRAVAPEGGGLTDPEVRPLREVRKGYTTFLSGDVIMAKITPCMENGKTTVVPIFPESICFGSTEFHVLRPEPGIAASWIAHFLLRHDFRQAAQRQMTGGVGQMRVPASFLEAEAVPVPPTAEQERILDTLEELLSDLDAGLAALQRAKAKLKLYRASVLKAAASGDLTADWRAVHPEAEPASALLDRILGERRQLWEAKQLEKFVTSGKPAQTNWKAKYQEPVAPSVSKLPTLPVGWCWATLDQLSEFITSGSRGWKEFYSDTGPLFIRSQDIRTDTVDLSRIACVNPPVGSEGKRTAVKKMDLLVTITGANVTKAALLKESIGEAYVSQHVGLIHFVLPTIANWVHQYITTPSGGRARLLEAAYGAGKPGLNLDNLKTLAIPLPPEEEQDRIVGLVNDQLNVITEASKESVTKMTTAGLLRQAILIAAFAGNLVSHDPQDESGPVLLQRVAAHRAARAVSKRSKSKNQSNLRKKRT
jgi:type I restriction enzyme S subunit